MIRPLVALACVALVAGVGFAADPAPAPRERADPEADLQRLRSMLKEIIERPRGIRQDATEGFLNGFG